MRELAAILLASLTVFAAAGSALASARSQHTFGLYAEGGASSAYSANVGFNVSDSVRLHAGTGLSLSPLRNGGYNAGGMYFFSSSDLSPFLGGTIAGLGASVKTPGISTGGLAADAGVDWSTSPGFNIGAKVSFPLSNLSSPGLSLFIGWYF